MGRADDLDVRVLVFHDFSRGRRKVSVGGINGIRVDGGLGENVGGKIASSIGSFHPFFVKDGVIFRLSGFGIACPHELSHVFVLINGSFDFDLIV